MRGTKIISNRAQCLECGDVIESKHRHDFVSCSCGKLFVDGGRDYLRRGTEGADTRWLELSEMDSGLDPDDALSPHEANAEWKEKGS